MNQTSSIGSQCVPVSCSFSQYGYQATFYCSFLFFLEKVAVVLLFLTAVVENGLDIPEFRLLLRCEWDE